MILGEKGFWAIIRKPKNEEEENKEKIIKKKKINEEYDNTREYNCKGREERLHV